MRAMLRCHCASQAVTPSDLAAKAVGTRGRLNLHARAPRASHRAAAGLSGTHGRPRDPTFGSASEPKLSRRRCRRCPPNVCRGRVTVRPPAGVGETGPVKTLGDPHHRFKVVCTAAACLHCCSRERGQEPIQRAHTAPLWSDGCRLAVEDQQLKMVMYVLYNTKNVRGALLERLQHTHGSEGGGDSGGSEVLMLALLVAASEIYTRRWNGCVCARLRACGTCGGAKAGGLAAAAVMVLVRMAWMGACKLAAHARGGGEGSGSAGADDFTVP